METENKNEGTPQNKWEQWHEYHHQHSRSGRIMGGIVIVVAGSIWLAKIMGADIPHWVFTWPMLLIVLGIFIGAKHSFRNFGWLIPVAIGGFFLLEHINPDIAIKPYLWPVVIILLGLMMIFKPKRKFTNRRWRRWEQWHQKQHYQYETGGNIQSEDRLDTVSVFGSVKKNVIDKDFKGGEVTCIFGGCELNLSQADINGTITLEVTQIFGGCTIIIPANWQLRSEMVTVLGSVEDKRAQPKDVAFTDKILVIQGTSVFGGIEIRNY